jgi:ubiquinone biosynthesis protein COQ9
MAGHAHATIRPLLLRHALPHIPAHGFSSAALSRASLSLPPPYQYSAALPQVGIETLFGRGREPERALVQEWLAERRGTLVAEFKALKHEREASKQKVELREVLERRLEMNEEVRPHLVDVSRVRSCSAEPSSPVCG